MRVIVDSSVDILYASFYIKGLKECFGKVTYSSKYFQEFVFNNKFFAFVIIDDADNLHRFVIDFGDSSKVDVSALNWSDVYGKVNTEFGECNPKITPLAPSFGITVYGFIPLIGLSVLNYLKAFKRIKNTRRFFGNYYHQWKSRQPLSCYLNTNRSNSHSVFFMGSLWKKEPVTNRFRANFIEACQSNANISFEGGFAPRKDISEFENRTAAQRVSMKQYLQKTKESCVVFNTPAVLSCHGWKLGEFLALGKAIISTPLSRKLPEELNCVHLVDGDDVKQMEDAVTLFSENLEYRAMMEQKSREYFETSASPMASIQLLLKKRRYVANK